jgi:hypothetical protein
MRQIRHQMGYLIRKHGRAGMADTTKVAGKDGRVPESREIEMKVRSL